MNTRLLGRLGAALFLTGVLSCAPAPRATQAKLPDSSIELVESEPSETSLDRPDLANASDVWPTMIDGAKKTIDVAQFYASEAEGDDLPGSKLTAVVGALVHARARAVRVRFLADASFASKYPAVLTELSHAGVDVRTIDVGKLSGGVLHAKYFVIDDEEVFLGSQNFDWRALEHIQELGVRARSVPLALAMRDVFETDWNLAAGGAREARVAEHSLGTSRLVLTSGERLSFVASPKGWLPDERTWDLPALVELIDQARSTVDVQVLSYRTRSRNGDPFPTLDEALRRAAARGVKVRLLVSQWAEKPGSDGRAALDALQAIAGVDVRVLVIPPSSKKEIPFARVAHAKYMAIDGRAASPFERKAWIGTSNWEGDYFDRTRNVGVVLEGGKLPSRLQQFFDENWQSTYARPPVTFTPERPVTP